ncbi:34072_t:CDS:2 [Gigaspora margarita]|uniref:34072_t:CDS:1 n=1 Tax=Gigaspora margarita TaxID=4874 RepID=A0ABM8W2W9_GIGMA|nr:34072_t:CDS:2 [Gigaspora margarita]
MTFAFTNYTDKDMFVMGDVSTNCVENTTNHMEHHFTNYTENIFTYHMVNSFTNPTWNTLASINYPVDTFSNYMDNTFTNNVMQMNVSEIPVFDYTESEDVDSYEAIQDTTNLDNHTNDENFCKIFSWSSLPDFLQAIFPSNYSYMIQCILKLPPHYTYEGFEIQQCEVDAFVNVSNEEGIKAWFSAFEEHSKMTMPQTKGYGVKGKQGDPKRKYPELIRNRNTGCAATLSLRLECRHLNSSHPFEIKICNHIVNCAESLSFRRVDEKICNKFIQMFHDGYSPATALYTHEDELHLSALSNKSLVETLADRAINLDYTYVVHLFENYRRAILQEYDSQMGKAFILCIVMGLMSRVHEKIQESGEICYVDASASFEPLNTSITLMYTSCVAGALPLELFVTFDELELTIEKAINLLKLILPEHAFFGCGCDVGPQNILTDDSAAERNALKNSWPQSNLLLCTFHILQAFWRWLYNSKNGISKEHRVIIMSQMKKVLYARTETDINHYYQELKNNYYQQFPLFAKYYERLWNQRQYWAHRFRLNLLLRGNHTNNYIERGFGLLKDIIFARTKAYNSVQVFSFITKNMERFYEHRLYGFAHRHLNYIEISKRFFCPGWETVDIDSIHQLANTDEYLVPSTNKESGLIYTVNSTIGTCNCFIGMSGAPCKHQGAVAMKYHIRIINFLPSLTPNDRMAFSYIASGFHVKDHSFYASLRTKPALIDLNNSINDNNNDLNAITIAKSKVDASNEFSEIENQEADFVDLSFDNFLAESAVGTSNELSKMNDQETGFDSSSFNNFLKEIEDDYKNCGSQLQTAFDKFAERYIAAKSQSIRRVTTFLYDHNLNSSARIKSRAAIQVQPEFVK